MILSEGSELLAKYKSNFWVSPDKATGEQAQLVVDLGCRKEINGFFIRNAHNGHRMNRASKEISIFVSNSPAEFNEKAVLTINFCNIEESKFQTHFYGLETNITFQYFMVQVNKFFKKGGGLHYISENESNRKGESYKGIQQYILKQCRH